MAWAFLNWLGLAEFACSKIIGSRHIYFTSQTTLPAVKRDSQGNTRLDCGKETRVWLKELYEHFELEDN
jgi:hypothetical protein